jgi:hypothetical protein
MRWNITRQAWIAVLSPCAADFCAFFENRQIVVSGFAQFNDRSDTGHTSANNGNALGMVALCVFIHD